MIQNLNSEEQANLHIVSNMDGSNLPPFLQSVLSLAQTPAEKDILLMATLTACGAVMPNLYCRYGIAAKRYYPSLQLFIVGSAACGKGIANFASANLYSVCCPAYYAASDFVFGVGLLFRHLLLQSNR